MELSPAKTEASLVPFQLYCSKHIFNDLSKNKNHYFSHLKKILGDDLAKNLEGAHVMICTFLKEGSCLPCGFVNNAKGGKWTEIYCLGGWIEGNQVKVVHSYQRLQFCEIEIFGIETGTFGFCYIYSVFRVFQFSYSSRATWCTI